MENKDIKKDISNNEIILFKKVSLVDKYNFYEYLSVMLDWGVSVTETLVSVESKIVSPYFKLKIKELISFISSWDSFSKSMKKIPDVFSSWEISIVESWETTGELSVSLLKLSEDLKKVHNLRNKIKWSLTYPIIVFLFLLLSLIIVLTFVIPEIKPLFETSDIELPVSTQMLISTSDFVINNFIAIFLSVVTFIVFIIWYANTRSWRKSIDNFLFWLPLIWKVYKNYILSNISSTLGNLVWSWVNVIKTLTLVWKSTNNSIYEWLFEEIIVRVSSWDKIVKAMEAVDPDKIYFPADFLQMLSVWERTANLESISKKLNAQYNKEVEYSLSNLTKWIEPLAIMLASVFVLWFAYAILWAILKITNSVW